MSNVPDAWEDEWSTTVDTPAATQAAEAKKPSSKQTKAQKRAQQAEFNRQLWAEAEGPKQTNYFLESRNVVPLRQDYKPPPVLLSRKGPIKQKTRTVPTDGISNLNLKDESSEDEDEASAKERTLLERQAQTAKEREEKQRKYEERRLELFGPTSNNGAVSGNNRSGGSSPSSLTPPQSRSSTPSRGGKRGRRGGSNMGPPQPRLLQQSNLFDPTYSPKPDSIYIQRRNQNASDVSVNESQPIRAPRGPDGSGRGGAGFLPRGGKSPQLTSFDSALPRVGEHSAR